MTNTGIKNPQNQVLNQITPNINNTPTYDKKTKKKTQS